MMLDTSTFAMSLSLDAMLCCGITAALTRVLPSSADALWRWSGSMLCFAACFVFFEFSINTPNVILSDFLPQCFGLIGAANILGASEEINGRRTSLNPIYLAIAGVFALGASFIFTESNALRTSATLVAMASMIAFGALRFASERRWRADFGGIMAILSVLAISLGNILLCVHFSGIAKIPPHLFAPMLLGFEASFLASSFAFILCASELARSQAIELSMRDGLTGLLTKRAFFEAASHALSRMKRTESTCTVLMVDIDFFKRINDTYGHIAGDAAIAHASKLVSGALRASDICARFGGEEFCALLPDTDSEGARQVAMRIIEAARQEPCRHIDPANGISIEMSFTVSIGAHSQKLTDSDSPHALLEKADQSLYASKKSGRDRLTCSSVDT